MIATMLNAPSTVGIASSRRTACNFTSTSRPVLPVRSLRSPSFRRVSMMAQKGEQIDEIQNIPITEAGEQDSYSRIEAPVRGGEGQPGSIPDGGPPVVERKNNLDNLLLQNDAPQEKAILNTAVAFPDAMRFKGAAPEVINSRLAMLGFVLAVIGEKTTGLPVWEQVKAAPVPIAATFALFSVASLIPILRGVPRKGGAEWPFGIAAFTPDAELINGRLAMVGFVGLIAFDFLSRAL